MAKSTDTAKGWYPEADRVAVPATNYAEGNRGRKAVVIHIMDGTMLGTIQRFTSSTAQVSAHFAIDKQGHVKQFVSVIDTAYANGISWNSRFWVDPNGQPLTGQYTPTWELLMPPVNPNFQTISIEREGKPADTPTPAMVDATVTLLRWLAEQFPSTLPPYVVKRTLIGHSNIAPRHRANCPGPKAGLDELAAAANGPKPTQTYTLLAPTAIFETPSTAGPIALGGRAQLRQGEKVEIDDERADGWWHLASGLGFVAKGVLG